MPRENQRRRTRQDLLRAGGRLLAEGRSPTMAEVAEEARVSRATAYRYFDSVDSLLCEAPLDADVPTPDGVFGGEPSLDPEQRVDKAEQQLHEMVYRNVPRLRAMLAHTLRRPGGDDVPLRQNRRMPLIERALEPARDEMKKRNYELLSRALALLFGTEAMVVFEDVLGVDEEEARAVKSWAIGVLVRGALAGTG